MGALRSKGRQRALEAGSSERAVRLSTIEVALDQTLENWYCYIKPIHLIKHLLTVKQFLNVVYYFVVIIFLSGLFKQLF
jgi:hypothetical protein